MHLASNISETRCSNALKKKKTTNSMTMRKIGESHRGKRERVENGELNNG